MLTVITLSLTHVTRTRLKVLQPVRAHPSAGKMGPTVIDKSQPMDSRIKLHDYTRTFDVCAQSNCRRTLPGEGHSRIRSPDGIRGIVRKIHVPQPCLFFFSFLRSLYLSAAVFGASASIYPLLGALGYHPYLGVIVESSNFHICNR